METSTNPSDQELLAALEARLDERRVALLQTDAVLDDMRRVTAKLEAAEGMKGRFLSNIRNEINNPLTVLRGFAAALAGDPTLTPEQVRQIASAMDREASSMAFQMQNIFAAADIEAGALDHSRSHIGVNTLLAEAISDLAGFASRKDVKVMLDPANPVEIVTDVPKLALIIANLLHNAIEFATSSVTVRLEAHCETMSISILDDGPGVPEKDRTRIFDRFVQLSVGTTRQHTGQGLGLSVSRAFAETIGASLDLVTSADGRTLFRLEVPLGLIGENEEQAEGANQFLFDTLEAF